MNPVSFFALNALFSQIYAGKSITRLQADAFISILMQNEVAFSTEYDPGTAKEAPSLKITISLSPAVSIVLSVTFADAK